MLKSLRIKNFGIIRDAEFSFGPGFTVLTGETGAGKSIIIDAISMLLGKSGSIELIKTNEEEAMIEGVFQLANSSEKLAPFLENSYELIVLRKLNRHKGTLARINNQTVTLKTLKEVMVDLISIVGQHEHLELFTVQKQLELLDFSAGAEFKQVKIKYESNYRQYQQLTERLKKAKLSEDELQQKKEFFYFQIQDIKNQNFKEEEEEVLQKIKLEQKNLHQIKTAIQNTKLSFEQINKNISESRQYLDKITQIEPFYADLAAYLEEIVLGINEKEQDLNTKFASLSEFDENEIENIETRLDLIFRYKNKYKVNSIKELIALHNRLQKEVYELEQLSADYSTIETQQQQLKQQIQVLAEQLNLLRKEQAIVFSKQIQEKMQHLGFLQANFKIEVNYNENNLTSQGADTVTFLVSTNPGEPLKLIQKVASGGELSRLMLSIRVNFLMHNPTNTVIFDEVDAGIGGITAIKIGEYLKLIAQKTQTFCVTHLAQVAKFADHHFVVSKAMQDKRTLVNIRLLDASDKTTEIKRMVGGQDIARLVSK
jgi:DNA repair protein RecN (Recombination protein N)